MVTIVASWDVRTAEAQVHMVLDSDTYDLDSRLSLAEAKVDELEALYGEQPVEIVMASARSLEDFQKTDHLFYGV